MDIPKGTGVIKAGSDTVSSLFQLVKTSRYGRLSLALIDVLMAP